MLDFFKDSDELHDAGIVEADCPRAARLVAELDEYLHLTPIIELLELFAKFEANHSGAPYHGITLDQYAALVFDQCTCVGERLA